MEKPNKTPVKRLTAAQIEALKPAEAGKRYEIADSVESGLRVRVTDKGAKSFCFYGRFGGSTSTRLGIGSWPAVTLEAARRRAHELRDAQAKKIDPRRADDDESFGAVMERFIKQKVAKLKQAKQTEGVIRGYILPKLGNVPLKSIGRKDAAKLIDSIKTTRPMQARQVQAHLRNFFNWAISRDLVEVNPCDKLEGIVCAPRTRTLTDDEIRGLWKAAGAIGYPYGPLLKLLLLTGARKSEIAELRWKPEVDLEQRVITLPPARVKSNMTHRIYLSDAAVAVLAEIEKQKGPYVFSHPAEHGYKVPNGFSKLTARVDASVGADDWTIHDIRRTVRTRLSPLTSFEVAEMIVGHAKQGMQRVYDQHAYEIEARAALEKWASRLWDILEPPPDNVVRLETAIA